MENTEQPSQSIDGIAKQILSEGETHKTQGDKRRQSLVLAAYQIIAESGFEGLRTRSVAARAGVNIATLHYYFAHKEDLVQSVVEYLLRQFMTAYLPDSSIEMGTPMEKIRGEMVELRHLLQEKPEMFVIYNELVLHSMHDTAIYRMITWLDEGWHGYLAQVIRDGKEQSIFRADLDVDSTATWLMLLNKGTALQWMTDPGAIDFERIQADVEHWLTY